MYCEDCKVTITTKTPVCPLCGKDLTADGANAAHYKTLERTYPRRKRNRRRSDDKFNIIYFIVAFNIAFVSILVNLLITPQIGWYLIVLAALVYVYFLVRGTINDMGYFPQKLFTQVILITLIIVAVQTVTDDYNWAYEYALPAIFCLSMAMVGVYLIIKQRSVRLFIFYMLALSVMAVIPFTVVVANDREVLWPSIATLALGASITITLFALNFKKVVKELKRKFHL